VLELVLPYRPRGCR